MNHKPANEWKHTTASNAHGNVAGVDLFDGKPGFTEIYERYDNGLRWPARTVDMSIEPHATDVLASWAAKGPVNDYREKNMGLKPVGRGAALSKFIEQLYGSDTQDENIIECLLDLFRLCDHGGISFADCYGKAITRKGQKSKTK